MKGGMLNLEFIVTNYELEKSGRGRSKKWGPQNIDFHKRP